MKLTVLDIVDDLGVTPVTVRHWVSQGRIKGTMTNRRIGYRFEKEEYEAFLLRNPKWRMVHNGELYKECEINARQNVLAGLSAKITACTELVKSETHEDQYYMGYNRAIMDIQSVIDREMNMKMPE